MLQNELTKIDGTKGADIAPLMNVVEAARILGLAPKTVNKRVRDGKLGCVQGSPRDRKFTIEQIRAYIDSQSVVPKIDKKGALPVKSQPPKGGDRQSHDGEKAKDSWASLKKEMSRWM